eukprot:1719263-Pyramimonas_sp.AAC.1
MARANFSVEASSSSSGKGGEGHGGGEGRRGSRFSGVLRPSLRPQDAWSRHGRISLGIRAKPPAAWALVRRRG